MGPLNGVTVVEIAGIGPAPTAGMMLADYGADVILIDRKSANANAGIDEAGMGKSAFFRRGKRSIALDLKNKEDIEKVLKLVEKADVLVEGFRPGVMERLGLGPDVCLERNSKLVYGRLTGWGQDGPLAHSSGHDVNYIALSGALYYTGYGTENPFPPATMLGDIGGGALIFLVGVLCALHHASATGEGQLIDSAITDGSAYMTTLLRSLRASGFVGDAPGKGFGCGESPWYNVYKCSDGKHISVGALEPNFYKELLERCDLDKDPVFKEQYAAQNWELGKATLTRLFSTQSREQWCELLEGTDICFAPVLNFDESVDHPHNKERDVFVEIDGITQPAPAPKFSKTPAVPGHVASINENEAEILGMLE